MKPLEAYFIRLMMVIVATMPSGWVLSSDFCLCQNIFWMTQKFLSKSHSLLCVSKKKPMSYLIFFVLHSASFHCSIQVVCPAVHSCGMDEMLEIALKIDEIQESIEVYRKRFQALFSLCSSTQSCIDDVSGVLDCWYENTNKFEEQCLRYAYLSYCRYVTELPIGYSHRV